jgi:glycosyltransferase involved in cell wall biosynthesis
MNPPEAVPHQERLRVAVLWQGLSSYARAGFLALTALGAEVMLIHRAATPDAPYDDVSLRAGFPGYSWHEAPPKKTDLRLKLQTFSPHAVLVSSWNVGAYRRVSRSMQDRSLRVLCMDNQWLGTPKQWAGRLLSRPLIRSAYDIVSLPGEPQAAFAKRLGFSDEDILYGLLACDYSAFAAAADLLTPDRRRSFIFVGRLAKEKGVDILISSYMKYRTEVSDPWPLVVCGTGPLADLLSAVKGVEMLGFVQPHDLPKVLKRTGCLLLPSTFEPWGVVIHEATSAGLAVVCSSACGASTQFVHDGRNGVVIPPGDSEALARAMVAISAASISSWRVMSEYSSALASQFTPDRWAYNLSVQIRKRVSSGQNGI